MPVEDYMLSKYGVIYFHKTHKMRVIGNLLGHVRVWGRYFRVLGRKSRASRIPVGSTSV